MDQQRPFLYLSLVFLGFLIWSTWQQEHAPKPIPPANSSVQQQANGNNSVPSGSSVSVNGTGVIPSGDAATSADAQVKQIHIKTDVLDIYINTHPHVDHLAKVKKLYDDIGISQLWHSGHI